MTAWKVNKTVDTTKEESTRAWFVPIYPPRAFDDGVRLGLWDESGVRDGHVVAERMQPMSEFS